MNPLAVHQVTLKFVIAQMKALVYKHAKETTPGAPVSPAKAAAVRQAILKRAPARVEVRACKRAKETTPGAPVSPVKAAVRQAILKSAPVRMEVRAYKRAKETIHGAFVKDARAVNAIPDHLNPVSALKAAPELSTVNQMEHGATAWTARPVVAIRGADAKRVVIAIQIASRNAQTERQIALTITL